MSLQLAAQHLSDHGRGPDDTLVHMSRNEVKSLNDLATAHGGQLTINPHTGLPEAGFLSSILPMVAGMAINAYAPGLGSAMTAALVGGGSYLLNPKQGLMGALSAGMGAYGGAGLGQSLATQGMQEVAASKLTEEAAKNAALEGGTLPSWYQQTAASTLTPAQIAAVKPTDFMGNVDMMGKGISSLGTEGGLSRLTQNMGGGMKMAQTALAAASPAIAESAKIQTPTAATPDKDMGQRYTYTPGTAKPLPAPDVPTYEDMLTKQGNFGKMQSYFPGQGYAQVTPDQAKNIYGFAAGGPVEQMSNNAAIGANTMYPMANMATSAFAVPYQDPKSTNMIQNLAPSGGGTVNMMSGEPNMQGTRLATGGISDAYKPENRDVDMYNDTGGPASAPSTSPSNGSPTGSALGDFGYAVSNQNFSPVAAAIASAMMDSMSPTSVTSVNAVNGMDSQSDTAPSGAPSSSSDGSPSSGDNGMGSSVGGEGEARGGLSPYFTHHMATGGISDAGYNLGGYSDGGRLLRGPGDGVSDSIPATIGHKQPARLADGEFVVPARIVSELGNGSTEAGARKLYAMMDRIQAARGKTVGKGRVAKNSRADKYLPA
jgi:hypothetical protein